MNEFVEFIVLIFNPGTQQNKYVLYGSFLFDRVQ